MFMTPRFDAPDTTKTEEPDSDRTTVSSRRSASAPSAARQRGMRLSGLVVTAGFLLSLAAGFLGGYLGSSHYRDASASTANLTQQRQIANNQGQLISSIAKTVGPSVVSVNVTTQGAPTTDLFGFSTGGGTEHAAGTGIIISSEGVVMTNRHVVPAGTTDVSVTLSDGSRLDNVKVIGRTSDNDSLDVAFLKINDTKGHKLTPAQIGDSSKMNVGDTVVAIGNALGQFSNTVTSGIISGFGRSVVASDSGGSSSSAENLDDLIQTDAAINQGNSGGPLVNTDGQVIGMNTAVSGQGQNIGFAIPINDLSGLIKQVLSTGKFQRPYLGVRYVRITPDVQKQYNLSVENGAYVLPAVDATQPSVISGSPADKAGVREGDIITEIDGTKLDQNNSLTSLVGQHSVGDTVHLTVLRDGKTMTLNATLQAMPQDNGSGSDTSSSQ